MDIDFDDPRIQFVGLILIGALILGGCVGGFAWLNDNRQAKDVATQFATIEPTIKTAQSRFQSASVVVAHRRADYPSHYSVQFDDQLRVAGERLAKGGQADIWLKELADAQQKRDWKTAYDRISKLGTIVSEDVAVIDRILGPPATEGQGFYDDLDGKSRAVDGGLVSDVEVHIGAVKGYIDMLPRKSLCGSSNTLTYGGAYGLVAQAQVILNDQAKVTAKTLVEGMVDKPAVYDQATAANSTADQAKASGDNDSASADQAPVQISGAQDAINNAALYVLTHSYRSFESAAAILSAQNNLNQAKDACYRADFGAVTAYVNAAIDAANSAIWLATEPTPTPEPPPTSVPSSSSSSSWDSSSSSSSSSDSGSWDSGGSDSGSWDSGGSDSGSWDSGGSDSGSWDSGGGDGGSWDDGGSDSGSW